MCLRSGISCMKKRNRVGDILNGLDIDTIREKASG